jgi:hypothetical protein
MERGNVALLALCSPTELAVASRSVRNATAEL